MKTMFSCVFVLYWLEPFWSDMDPLAVRTTRAALLAIRRLNGMSTLAAEIWLYVFGFLPRLAYNYNSKNQ